MAIPMAHPMEVRTDEDAFSEAPTLGKEEPLRTDIGLTDEAALVVELMPDGRLRAPSAPARALLRERLRKAELLRTGPGLSVLRTLDPVNGGQVKGGSIPDREVVAAGSICDGAIPLIDFIGFLAGGLQTGVLTAATGDIKRSVYFNSGDVVWASSNAPGDRLGEFLLKHGRITPDQLHLVLLDGEKRIGRACVERGFMAAHELRDMLAAQLTDIFDKLIATNQGVWWFARISAAVMAESQFHLSTQGLLVDAVRRLDELQVYREHIKGAEVALQSNRCEVALRSERLGQIEESIREEAEQVLNALSGTASATIAELIRMLGKGEFEITRCAYHLLHRGLIGVVEQYQTSPILRTPDPISHTKASEIIGIYAMAIHEMFHEVARTGKGIALQQAANAFLSDKTTAFAHVLQSVSIGPEGSVDEAALLTLTQQSITSLELSQALSDLIFFLLFQATEFLGRRRGDDLSRRVKLIIGLLASTGISSGGSDG